MSIAGGKSIGGEKPASTRLFLAVVVLAVFTTVLTATMLNVVLPLVRTEFGASAAQVGWVITGYALAYAIGVPLYGRISDFFGVRRVFAFGLMGTAPFSDDFLAMVFALIVALVAAFGLRGHIERSKSDHESLTP